MKNPFFQDGAGDPPAPDDSQPGAEPAAAATLFGDAEETPSGDSEPEGDGEPAAVEALFPPEPPAPGKKGAELSQNPAWRRIVKARDEAVSQLEPLKSRVAELEALSPIAEAVRKRYEGRGDDPVAAMNWDSSFVDTFESLLQSDPDVQAVARKVAAKMTGQPPQNNGAANGGTPRTDPAPKPAPATPARDERVELLLQRQAQGDVEAQLRDLGIADRRVKGMASYIVRHATDPSRIGETEINAIGRRYVEENGFTREELLAAAAERTQTRRPPTAGGRGAPSAAAAASEDDPEKPTAEFKDLKSWGKFKEKFIRAFPGANPGS